MEDKGRKGIREIKFRCWHLLGKDFKEPAMLYDIKPGDCLVWLSQGQRIESVMQFTGLKDKNGKEIWEGDILRSHGLTFPIHVDCFHGYRFIWGQDQICLAFAQTGEVIGNIYENPELLS